MGAPGRIGRALWGWARWAGEALLALAAAGAVVAIVALPQYALRSLPPRGESAARIEPPVAVGARVETPYGWGVVTREVAYWDGPMWQVRLDSGRYVVLYRKDIRVVAHPGGGETP